MLKPKPTSLIDFYGVSRADTIVAQMPATWFVVFHTETKRRWLHWLAFGRFKHVSCFGWVDSAQRWIFFDPTLDRAWLRLVPDDVANDEPAHKFDIAAGYYGGDIGHYTRRGVVVCVRPDTARHSANRGGIGCVRDVARLTGIKTWALRPDAFFKRCLALGGVVMNPERMPK